MNERKDSAEKRRLYLRLPKNQEWSVLLSLLPSLLEAKDIACILLPEIEERHIGEASRVCKAIQSFDIAVLIRENWELVKNIGADGVHLSNPRQCSVARKVLGAEKSLGVLCSLERHEALIAGEDGADYIAFAVTEETKAIAQDILEWWQEMMLIPTTLFLEEPGLEKSDLLALADFYSPPC